MELVLAGDRRRQALDKIRRDRETTIAEIEATAEARLSLDETVQRLVARLREEATRAEQRVLAFANPTTVPDSLAIDLGFLLWLDPPAFERQLRARLKSILPSGGLPQADRPKKVAALRARLGELDEAEEREVVRLEAQGLAVDRRSDADLAKLLRVWDSLDANAA